MIKIPLSKGGFTLIDDVDFDLVSKYRWYKNKVGYAVNDTHTRKSLHRLLMSFPKSGVDHINKNKLDNRRSNLRVCNQSQNTANSAKRTTNTSGFKGISFEKRNPNMKWVVNLTKNYKHIYGGAFRTKHEAAKRYSELAKELFGEFAST
jgi:hypothetical protein